MMNRRLALLSIAAAVLAGLLVWRWVSGWGLVSVNFENAPLSQVIAVLQRKGNVQIVTNADLSTTVTLQARRAPIYEILDILAVRLDGDARTVYVLGPDAAKVLEGAAAVASPRRPEGWRIFSGGWGGFGFGESVPDLRRISLRLDAGEKNDLHSAADQAAQKTGATFVVPADWNPALGELPKAGALRSVAAGLAKAARGMSAELVLLSVRGARDEGGRPGRGGSGDTAGGTPSGAPGGWQGGQWPSRAEGVPADARRPGGENRERPGGRANMEWAAERALAQIALLPASEQEQARQDWQEMRAFWEEVRSLPEDQRRAKIEEAMSRTDVQDRMDERAAQRDLKRTPEQRASRYKAYVERKKQALERQQQSPAR